MIVALDKLASRERTHRLASNGSSVAGVFFCPGHRNCHGKRERLAGSRPDHEAPIVFTASQVLPPDLAHSPNYTVDERVGLENFQYVYQLKTKWGSFNVKGSDLLRVRAREIAATAKLETVAGAKTAVIAAGSTAMRPVETAKDLVTAPGQTIGDTVKGVGHIFSSAAATMHSLTNRTTRLSWKLGHGRRHGKAQACLRSRRRS